jgi:adenylosuccinate synthase
LKRSVIINGVSGLCITKLDVLDGLPEIKVCVGYQQNGRALDILPSGADEVAACRPVYETLPGWSDTTAGLTNWEQLPTNARRYLERLEALTGTPVDMVSTGPDRVHTILLRHPFRK